MGVGKRGGKAMCPCRRRQGGKQQQVPAQKRRGRGPEQAEATEAGRPRCLSAFPGVSEPAARRVVPSAGAAARAAGTGAGALHAPGSATRTPRQGGSAPKPSVPRLQRHGCASPSHVRPGQGQGKGGRARAEVTDVQERWPGPPSQALLASPSLPSSAKRVAGDNTAATGAGREPCLSAAGAAGKQGWDLGTSVSVAPPPSPRAARCLHVSLPSPDQRGDSAFCYVRRADIN